MTQSTAEDGGDGTEDSSGLWGWHSRLKRIVVIARNKVENGWDGTEDSNG